jgi:hypothetical protein
MSAMPSTAGRIGRGLVLVITALVAAGCAAGQQAQTANEKATIDGTYGSVGKLDLRGVAIEPPTGSQPYAAGADVKLDLLVVNNGGTADSLTGVTSTAFGSWGSYDSADDANTVIGAGSAGANDPSLPKAGTTVSVQPGDATGFGIGVAPKTLLLRGLKAKLYPANSIKITFAFAKAGSLTLDVPVALAKNLPNLTVPPVSSGAEG